VFNMQEEPVTGGGVRDVFIHCEYKAQKFRAKLTKLVRTCGDFCVI
jgi:hypothetical protein